MEIREIPVIGADAMVAGIAQVAIEAGFKVTLCDIEESFVAKGKSTIETFMNCKPERQMDLLRERIRSRLVSGSKGMLCRYL